MPLKTALGKRPRAIALINCNFFGSEQKELHIQTIKINDQIITSTKASPWDGIEPNHFSFLTGCASVLPMACSILILDRIAHCLQPVLLSNCCKSLHAGPSIKQYLLSALGCSRQRVGRGLDR